jgi:hypothetical protein
MPRPTERPPASCAPRLAASMMPGPAPEQDEALPFRKLERPPGHPRRRARRPGLVIGGAAQVDLGDAQGGRPSLAAVALSARGHGLALLRAACARPLGGKVRADPNMTTVFRTLCFLNRRCGSVPSGRQDADVRARKACP